MQTLNQVICDNLSAELSMAQGKRSALISANLPTNKIDERIDALRANLNRFKTLVELEVDAERNGK